MWSLLRAEFTRLRWRRAVLVLLAAMILVPGVLFVAEAYNTRPATEAEHAEAEERFAADQTWMAEEMDNCVASPEDYGISTSETQDEDALRTACADSMGGAESPEDYLYRSQMDIQNSNQDVGVAVLTLLALLGALIATTFVGHDWASGSMSNQLLFESRRVRIWMAKAAAVVLGVLLVAAVTVVLFWGAISILAQVRDVEATSAVWRDVAWTQARGLGVVAAATLGAYALTMWFRSTVGSLGLMFGVTLFSSLLIGIVFQEGAPRWMLPSNAMAVIMDGFDYWVQGTNCDEFGNCEEDTRTLSALHGVTYLGTLLVAIVIPSILTFRHRDVP